MIEFLQGKIIAFRPNGIILDVGGVGYGVSITTSRISLSLNPKFISAEVNSVSNFLSTGLGVAV